MGESTHTYPLAHTHTHMHTHAHTHVHMHTHTCTHTHTHDTHLPWRRAKKRRRQDLFFCPRFSSQPWRRTANLLRASDCMLACHADKRSEEWGGAGENNGITASTTAASAIEASITVGGKETQFTRTHTHTEQQQSEAVKDSQS